MNKTIHQLNEISQIQNEDEFVVFDTAEGNSKKYKFEAMRFPVGMIIQYYGTTPPSSHWLICDGRDTTGTDEELAIVYPVLYSLLGNSNKLPDLQECVLVGIGHNRTNIFDSSETNTSTGLAGTQTHDEYTVGQFKDDQLQNITGQFYLNEGTPNKPGQAIRGYANGAFSMGNSFNGSTLQASVVSRYYQDPNQLGIVNLNASNVARTGSVTHGKQVGVNFLIRAD